MKRFDRPGYETMMNRVNFLPVSDVLSDPSQVVWFLVGQGLSFREVL